MKLYLIRHGETDWNKQRRFQGQSDIPLNEYGIKLAEITSEAFKNVHFDYIYSSPLLRAYKTAEIMRRDRNLPIITDERLIEMGFGVNEGIPSADIKEVLDLFFNHPEKYVAPEGGESYEDVCNRTKDFIEHELIPLSIKEPDASVLLAAHGALIKCLIKNLENLEIKDIWSGAFLKNCAIVEYEINGAKISLAKDVSIYYDEVSPNNNKNPYEVK